MGRRYKGSFISSTETGTNTAQAQPGVWPLDQQMQAKGQCAWPIAPTPPGQVNYTANGTYTWVAPQGITSVSLLMVSQGAAGGNASSFQFCYYCYCCPSFSNYPIYVSGYASGSGGKGGTLGYRNNLTVTPGSSYTVVLTGTAGQYSSFSGPGVTPVQLQNPTGYSGSTGSSNLTTSYDGGGGGYQATTSNANYRYGYPSFPSTYPCGSGGGGAGGYSGQGGNQGDSGVGGGGGGGRSGGTSNAGQPGGAGGGVGLLGQGASGAGGATNGAPGSPGSGGSGQLYGGGGRGGAQYGTGSTGGQGAIRIIWPGNTRSYPSTNTGDL